MAGGTTFCFVTDGLDAALYRARDASGGMDVRIAGGASIVRQALAAGAIDDIYLDIVPVAMIPSSMGRGGVYTTSGGSLDQIHPHSLPGRLWPAD